MRGNWQALGVSLLLWCGSALGFDKSSYCATASDPMSFKAQAYMRENHLAVRNHGGLINGGVCWWHSLFQRAALYLTTFDPSQQKPNQAAVEKIVHAIATGKQVVVIPGYKNLNDFSRDHWNTIQAKLEEWQLVDGFWKQAWIQSITSSWSLDPAKLGKTMDNIYIDVEKKKQIEWVMLKVNGIGAHAWLIVDIISTVKGYEMAVIDSNRPEDMLNIKYERGMKSLQSTVGLVAPYRGRNSFFIHSKLARERFCQRHPLTIERQPLTNDFY